MKACLPLLLLIASFAAYGLDTRVLDVPFVVADVEVPYPVFAIYPLPKEELTLRWTDDAPAEVGYQGRSASGTTVQVTAPATPGHTLLTLSREDPQQLVQLHVFTRVPFSRLDSSGTIQGYRIGHYPQRALRGEQIYQKPRGFVEVNPQDEQVLVSPNFRLGEFLSKQPQGYPKYLVLRPALLLKLEYVLRQLNEKAFPVERLVIMSGYRTPSYNRSIGNVQYSRHVWGGAADIFIDDQPRDGRMDDLNHDGKIDRDDARWLAKFVHGLSIAGGFSAHIGGLSAYGSTAAHGPFVHVDVRGTRARW